MGLLSHLTHPKGKIWITLDKATFQEGEAVAGKVNIEAEEYIQSKGVKVEARVVESLSRTSTKFVEVDQEPVAVDMMTAVSIQDL